MENSYVHFFKLPILAPEFIMETKNKETLKQKQVTISIFMVLEYHFNKKEAKKK